MKKVAKFEKVSYNEFEKAVTEFHYQERHGIVGFNFTYLPELYDEIKLPKRSTKSSAGYDFYNNMWKDLEIGPGETLKIPTGVRCKMDEDWVLMAFPRSGLGFKYRLQLDNTVGIVDADYYYSDNEGHIFLKITNDSKFKKICKIEKGKAFAQGIFLPYGITEDDDATGIRNGGFGSTDK